MKTKWHDYKQGWGRALSALLALALAAGLVLTAPPLDGPALATDPVPATTEGEGGDKAPEEPAATGGANTGLASQFAADHSSTLTLVFPGWTAMGERPDEFEMSERAKLEKTTTVDYYKIADAVPISGYNAYEFFVKEESAYYDVIAAYVYPNNTAKDNFVCTPVDDGLRFRYAPKDLNSAPVSDWTDLMELIAKTCFDKKIEPTQTNASGIGDKSPELEAGLYLTVVHGTAVAEDAYPVKGTQLPENPVDSIYPSYLIEEKVMGANGKPETDVNGNPATVYRSIAYTDTKIYIFQPQLIALPGTAGGDPALVGQLTDDPTSPDYNPNGYATTANGGDWQTDVTAVVKYTVRQRYADLEIVKTLENYAGSGNPASFVFEIVAKDPNDPDNPDNWITVHKTITFDGAGTSDPVRIIDLIPAGWNVTITEVDTGTEYDGTKTPDATLKDNLGPNGHEAGALQPTSGEKTITINAIPGGTVTRIAAPGVGTVALPDGSTVVTSFTNDYVPNNNDGGSVVNIFTSPGMDGNGWTWTKKHYDSETQKWTTEGPTPVSGTAATPET